MTLTLAAGERGQFHIEASLPLGERVPGTHWIGGWVDPRAGFDDMEKRKFLILQFPQLSIQ
jgi:hypothetical protein